MTDTIEQPTNTPTTKIAAASAAGAVATLAVFIAGQFGLEITPEAAAAFATVLAFVAGYFKRERAA